MIAFFGNKTCCRVDFMEEELENKQSVGNYVTG